MAVANSGALEVAGCTADTKDPPGGEIGRDAKGEPTGLLKDAAMGFVGRVVPPLTAEARLAVIRQGLKHAASLGVTSVQDMNPAYEDVAAYADLLERGELTARFYSAPLETEWVVHAKLGLRPAFGV